MRSLNALCRLLHRFTAGIGNGVKARKRDLLMRIDDDLRSHEDADNTWDESVNIHHRKTLDLLKEARDEIEDLTWHRSTK